MKRKLWLTCFYFLSFTWGIVMSLIGLFALLWCACGRTVHTYHGRVYGTIGESWGGISLGCFFFCGERDQEDYIQSHECGHGIQNIILGPLFPFLVGIPSAARFWIFELRDRKGKPNPDYDAIWFEGSATKIGKQYIETDIL